MVEHALSVYEDVGSVHDSYPTLCMQMKKKRICICTVGPEGGTVFGLLFIFVSLTQDRQAFRH